MLKILKRGGQESIRVEEVERGRRGLSMSGQD